jgi:hypothetical protein
MSKRFVVVGEPRFLRDTWGGRKKFKSHLYRDDVKIHKVTNDLRVAGKEIRRLVWSIP